MGCSKTTMSQGQQQQALQLAYLLSLLGSLQRLGGSTGPEESAGILYMTTIREPNALSLETLKSNSAFTLPLHFALRS